MNPTNEQFLKLNQLDRIEFMMRHQRLEEREPDPAPFNNLLMLLAIFVVLMEFMAQILYYVSGKRFWMEFAQDFASSITFYFGVIFALVIIYYILAFVRYYQIRDKKRELYSEFFEKKRSSKK